MLPRKRRRCLMLERLGVLGIVLALSACSLFAPKYSKPVVAVTKIQLLGGNFLQQNFLLKLHIENPNGRALPVTSLHADLNMLGEKVASGVNNRSFVVPARGETDFDMTITSNLAIALLKLASRADRQGDVDYEVTGQASIDLPFLRDLPFAQRGSFSTAELLGPRNNNSLK